MPLVYQPDSVTFFLRDHPHPHQVWTLLTQRGRAAEARLVLPGAVRTVPGLSLPFAPTIADLAAMPTARLSSLPPTFALWALASRFAADLVERQHVVPGVVEHADGALRAQWHAALAGPDDAAHVAALSRSMPPAAHAIPVPGGHARDVWSPEALLRHFLDAAVDALVRAAFDVGARVHRPVRGPVPQSAAAWPQRWLTALVRPDRRVEPDGLMAGRLADEVAGWNAPARGLQGRLRACFRLDVPADATGTTFRLHYLLQSPDDPELVVPAADVWQAKGRRFERFGRAFSDPQEALLEALGRASRLFEPIAESLQQPTPDGIDLSPQTAWAFLAEGAPALLEAGFGVVLPEAFTTSGDRRLRLRMRVGDDQTRTGEVGASPELGLDALVDFAWEAAIGDTSITAKELAALARQKAPLVRYRGEWVAVDPRELARISTQLAAGGGQVTLRQALQGALAGETRQDGLTISVIAAGDVAAMIGRLRDGAGADVEVPETLHATLRPYQVRGLAWLSTLASVGLGACLADDMGLGKTIQVLAFLLRRRLDRPHDTRPVLIVAPTSVVGNWQREAARFSPDLPVRQHYGADRSRQPAQLSRTPGAVVVTTYGVLRRDVRLLSKVDWAVVVLDEAQNIKNPASATARAARALPGTHRIALTGTPVENRLAELWSILEFANPGLLGSLDAFTQLYAVPIERHGDERAARRLRRLTAPFVLRRLKSDRSVVQDLPDKLVMQVVCTLTLEQATLYRVVVDEALRGIESSEGIERRGRVLTLLMHLKQVCNHPAQFLDEAGPLSGRSGKLARLTEMLDEALAAGDKALVFTQFREMGARLATHLERHLREEILFLHGGTPRAARDEMVRRFQDAPDGPRIFVLSLKAGGTGLNLTAATHVFHYDRWWNPAVEDQATDRAYRIGQTRGVQVHAMVCAGTVEDKVADLLERKRSLAAKVVGTGERWITELGNTELRELFALASDAVIDTEAGDLDEDEADEAGAQS